MNNLKNVPANANNENNANDTDNYNKVYCIAGIDACDLDYAVENLYNISDPDIKEFMDKNDQKILKIAQESLWDYLDAVDFGAIEQEHMVKAFRKVAEEEKIDLYRW